MRKKKEGGNAIINSRNNTGIPVRNLINGNDDIAITIYMKKSMNANDDQKMTTFSSSFDSSCAETMDIVNKNGNSLFISYQYIFF